MDFRKTAVAAYERGDREGAAKAFASALESGAPKSTARDLAIVYCELGRFGEAVDALEPYLAEDPSDTIAWCALSNALLEQNRSEEALQAARKAIAIAPESWVALLAVANALTDLGEFDEARDALVAANRVAPKQPEPLVNLSALNARTHDAAGAVAAAERAIALVPNDVAAHVNLGIAHLLRGEYGIGFAEYEWRLRDPARASLYHRGSLPLWNSAPMRDGTLFVGIEQGIGDFLCLSRLLREARKRVGRIVCEVPESLVGLYANFDGIDAIQVPGERVFGERYSAFVPVASLPHVLQFSPERSRATPYLRADPVRTEVFAQQFSAYGKRRKIGIVWSGNPAYRMDRHRSLPIAALAGLRALDDVAWISLQKGPAQEHVASLPLHVHAFGNALSDFTDTAAAIEALDLVITVDTAVAHLAGALGKPVWVTIGQAQHWLWQLDRSDSPWYPSMRLFRQQTPNRWDEVIAEIATNLSTA